MLWLILGLLIFLGAHSVRIVAEDWRSATIARLGAQRWKGLYSLVSVIGFVLIVWGYGQARLQTGFLWTPPIALRHLALLLAALSFVLITAAYVPRNGIKARLHHPMVLGVKTWALAHLLANGSVADVLLFGAFLLWAVADFSAARRRDRVAGTTYGPGTPGATLATVAIGLVAAAVFVLWLHGPLIGVAPLG